MILFKSLWPAFVLAGLLQAQGTRVVFDAGAAAPIPFPADTVTVADSAQKTGLRMNLPLPDCQAEPSTCQEIVLINELDGFSLNPRINVRFSAPVNPDTLRDGISFVWLDNLTTDEPGLHPVGRLTPINQVLYDPQTNTAYAKPDEILYQHRRYAIIVTDAVRDTAGRPVSADPAYQACLAQTAGYCGRLRQAVTLAAPKFAPREIVAASVFTTLSATAWLESARDQLRNTSPGYRLDKAFEVRGIATFTGNTHTGVSPASMTSSALPLNGLGGLAKLAFGSYRSPRFLNERQVIPAWPTGRSVPLPAASEEISVAAFLPDGPAPASGYPVVIFGHGAGGLFFNSANQLASNFAERGFATIGINAVGHAGGPQTTVTIKDHSGRSTEVKYTGRAVDADGNGVYSTNEGCYLWGVPGQPKVATRDCARQTVLDTIQLVRAIRIGMDLTGDGVPDLDPSRIYYVGYSMGVFFGTVLAAVEPGIAVAVLHSGAGSVATTRMWKRQANVVSARTPSLLNRGNDYDLDYVLRDRGVELIDVPGALALQEFFERLEWRQMTGDPLAYAVHLGQSPLPGVPVKRVLFQFGIGDLTVPNNTEAALVRAAYRSDSTLLYRHDVARALMPKLNADAHQSLWPLYVPGDVLGQYIIGMMIQQQMAEFLASHGYVIPDLNPVARWLFGKDLFEIPVILPEDTNL